MELYLPPTYAKITRGCEYYETTDTFKRRSAASKAKMLKYWSDPSNRQRIDTKQAKPVDVFDEHGNFVASYPSARKAAIALFTDIDYHSAERVIRACRQGIKKQYRGFRFKPAHPCRRYIGELLNAKKTSSKTGRKDAPWLCKSCTLTFNDRETIHFDSLKACAKAIGGTYNGIWMAMKQNRKYKDYIITINI